MNLAEKLINLRKEKGKTQKQVVADLGMGITTLRNLENINLNRLPDSNTLKKLKNYYNVPYEYLLDDECLNKTPAKIYISKELGLSDKSINIIKRLQNTDFQLINDKELLINQLNYFLENFKAFDKFLLNNSYIEYYDKVYNYTKVVTGIVSEILFNDDLSIIDYINDMDLDKIDSIILKLSDLIFSFEKTYGFPDDDTKNIFDKMPIAYSNFKDILKQNERDDEVIKKSLGEIFYIAYKLFKHAEEQSDLSKFRISNMINKFLSI